MAELATYGPAPAFCRLEELGANESVTGPFVKDFVGAWPVSVLRSTERSAAFADAPSDKRVAEAIAVVAARIAWDVFTKMICAVQQP